MRKPESSPTPYTALLPPLTESEYQALKADIAVRGVLVPVEVLPDGTLLDGHHRARAASELGLVGYPRTVRAGLDTEAERVAHVLALHAHRRHLSPEARQALITKLRVDGLSVRAISALTGVARSTVAAHVPIGTPGETLGLDGKTYTRQRRPRPGPTGVTVGSTAEQNRASAALRSLTTETVSGKQLTLHRAERLAREARLVSARCDVKDSVIPASTDLRLGDFRTVLADVADNSVDLVITDPPWTAEAIRSGLWKDVGVFAGRVLRPGGHAAVYTGTQALPLVLAELSRVEGLEYRWMIAVTNGDSSAAAARLPRISSRWRPVVIYRRTGGCPARWLPSDWIEGGGRSREHHKWEQGVGEAEDLINMLSDVGAVVLDMCAGSGTTGIASHRAGGRSWIGAELNVDTHATARSRLAGLEGWTTLG